MNAQNTTDHPFRTNLERALSNGNYKTNIIDMGEYGTSAEITRHGSDKKLHITLLEDDLIDAIMCDKDGTTIFQLTIFTGAARNLTPGKLDDIIAICF